MGKKSKNIREKGKIQFSRYFQEFENGDSVSVVREKSVMSSFPERIQGRTGLIEGKQGRSYIVELKDMNQKKKFLIQPVHLRREEIMEAKVK